MQRRAGAGQPLHEGHRRAAIEIGVMAPLLFENAEHAGLVSWPGIPLEIFALAICVTPR